ncbi:uncharacterized protein LOC113019126 [Astatotilapia calliptera]|uniref:uncharacterized protein LOC113019126 n=1 Tax=Astatotilapia calliptera TaxID=8154 RepID=UPI000E41F203|nr:uncharacterized protein LOC113019126 [Astatotilapia calliptera]
MENITHVMSKSPYGPKMEFNWGVVVNTNLAGGILLSTSLLGLATYIGAFWDQRGALSLFKRSFITSFSCDHGNLKGVQNTHVSLFALIFIDVLNVIGAMTLGSHLVAATCPGNTCLYTENLWMFSRRYLVMIHLLTALISILYLCHPHLGSKLRCVFSVVSLLICVLYYSSVHYTIEVLYMQEVLTCGLALAITAKSKLTGRKKDKLRIVTVALCTFLVVYLPVFVLDYLIYSRTISGLPIEDYFIIYVNVYYFTNFQVFLDGLLCYSILKMSAAEEEQQPQQWELQEQGLQQLPQQSQQQLPQPPRPWQQQPPLQQSQQQSPQPPQPWQQQPPPQQWQQQQQQGLICPRVHVNTNAITAYNRQNWN